MDVLAFDGRTGAAGDMILGALLAAGAEPAVLAPVEDALGVTYVVSETTRQGVRATRVDVQLEGADVADSRAPNRPGDSLAHDESGRDHSHGEADHAHHDGSGHRGHEHASGRARDRRGAERAEGAGPRRSYRDVVDVVESMDLRPPVMADALAIFEILGEAEAEVHGTDLESTHFHEVGADDAVADVVGAALLLSDLDPDRVVTTPLSTGAGEVQTSHGRYPVPPPAVVEIAERADWSLRGGPVEAELLTPTGAAILAHVAGGVESVPPVRVTASGYGAGRRELPDRPNVLRAIVGDGGTGLAREEIRVLETAVDDVSPEVLGGLQETLAEAGALDVSIVPTTMKKSRPGHLVSVVARPEDAARVARRLAVETGTLGVREAGATHRWVADREVETVAVEIDGEAHAVGVKVASDGEGAVYDVSAEFDDAAAVARETGLAVRDVMRLAERAYREGDSG